MENTLVSDDDILATKSKGVKSGGSALTGVVATVNRGKKQVSREISTTKQTRNVNKGFKSQIKDKSEQLKIPKVIDNAISVKTDTLRIDSTPEADFANEKITFEELLSVHLANEESSSDEANEDNSSADDDPDYVPSSKDVLHEIVSKNVVTKKPARTPQTRNQRSLPSLLNGANNSLSLSYK